MSDSDCLCALLASLGGGAELLVDLRNIDIESPNGLSPYLCLDSPLLAVDDAE